MSADAGMLPPDRSHWWTNRRRMAWLALACLVAIGGAMLWREEDIGPNTANVLIAVVYILGGLVIIYITAATIDDVKQAGIWRGK